MYNAEHLAWIFHKPSRNTCWEVFHDGMSHRKGIFG
jgi:hypothetical protein